MQKAVVATLETRDSQIRGRNPKSAILYSLVDHGFDRR
jgi:hypothetical protein